MEFWQECSEGFGYLYFKCLKLSTYIRPLIRITYYILEYTQYLVRSGEVTRVFSIVGVYLLSSNASSTGDDIDGPGSIILKVVFIHCQLIPDTLRLVL